MARFPLLSSDTLRRVPPVARGIALAVLAGTLLALLGPFGTYLNGDPVRLLGYWIGATLLGLLLYGWAYRIVAARFTIGAWRGWLALLGATLAASIPEALATRTAAFQLWPDLAHRDLPLALWFAQTASIGLVAIGAHALLRRPARRAAAAPAPIASPVDRLGRDVLALQMEDHYVRVHRATGSELILMPMSRAIAAMQGEGLRTHRSWWVARHAVTAVEGNSRSMRVQLSNGVIAPVARSAVTHLKAAGWIIALTPDD